ncbi:MAG: hypothetical protein HGA45_34045 [Chloroflexales bacterium]|nr:hypothetical protein [Chloroflexales bacterium]
MQATPASGSVMRKRIVLKPEFAEIIAKAGFSITEFAAAAGVERTTLHALINPSQHPQRKGGMMRTTAWKIANAYAGRAGVSAEDAYAKLLAEELR